MTRIALLLLTLGAALHTPAVTRFVYYRSDTPMPPYTNLQTAAVNIQDAVDICNDGDVVKVGGGTYDAGGAPAPGFTLSNRVMIAKRIRVESITDAARTIIIGAADPGTGGKGTNAVRCAYLTNGAELVGFTLSNGYTRLGWFPINHDRYGGGAALDHGGILQSCVVTHCYAFYKGGGVTLEGGGLVDNCVIRNCRAGSGGGVVFQEGGEVRNSTLEHNRADSGPNVSTAGGGGAYSISGLLYNCVIRHNIAQAGEESKGGGAILFESGQMIGCTVQSNYTESWGGGAYVYKGGLVRNCAFMGNEADKNGGGVNIITTGTVQGCLFALNKSGSYGGGIACGFGGVVQNCSVANNQAKYGGGIQCNYGGAVWNTIVYFNTGLSNNPDFRISGSSPRISHCCAPDVITGTYDMGGNITGDPMFVNRAGFNFRLPETSPCVDTGTNLPWTLAPGAVDLDGSNRISAVTAEIVDMGCYEYPAEKPEPKRIPITSPNWKLKIKKKSVLRGKPVAPLLPEYLTNGYGVGMWDLDQDVNFDGPRQLDTKNGKVWKFKDKSDKTAKIIYKAKFRKKKGDFKTKLKYIYRGQMPMSNEPYAAPLEP
jgi:hypothetical protein